MKNYSIPKTIALSLGVLVMSLLFSFIVLAWTEPSSSPPLGNVADLIRMALGVPQIETSTHPSIWIKDSGGGDLIRLETEDSVKFTVENTGKTIIGGEVGEMDLSGNRISNLGLPLSLSDAATKEFVMDYVDASNPEGTEPVFTKCQVKKNSSIVRPNCPDGWATLHEYSMANVDKDLGGYGGHGYLGLGITPQNVDDNSWWSNSTLSCSVCQKIASTAKIVGEECSYDAACGSGVCGTNADNDNYFSESAGHTGICYATSLPYTDCYDENSNVHPGQSNYYAGHRGDGSFDYNCDGSATKEPSKNCQHNLSSGCSTSPALSKHGGYSGTIPACGESQDWMGFRLYHGSSSCSGSSWWSTSCCTDCNGPDPNSGQSWKRDLKSDPVTMRCH